MPGTHFPEIVADVSGPGNAAAAAPSFNATLPAALPGDAYLLAVTRDSHGSPGISLPAGWVELGEVVGPSGALVAAWYWRIVDGTEGASVPVTFDASDGYSWQVIRVRGADPLTLPEVVSAQGTGTSANAPALDPAAWDVENTLWLLAIHADQATTAGAPSGFANIDPGGVNTDAAIGSYTSLKSREQAVASQDPAATSIVVNEEWIAATIAIRPGDKPWVVGYNGGASQNTVASHGVLLPGNPVEVGDLLLVIDAQFQTGAGFSIADAGWASLGFHALGSLGLGVWWKQHDGSEPSPTVSYPVSTSYAYQTIAVRNWNGLDLPELAFLDNTSVNPDAPELNPVGWGIKDSVWIATAAFAHNGTVTSVNGFPAGYYGSNDQGVQNATGGRVASAWKRLKTVQEHPGEFVLGASKPWIAITMATPSFDAQIPDLALLV